MALRQVSIASRHSEGVQVAWCWCGNQNDDVVGAGMGGVEANTGGVETIFGGFETNLFGVETKSGGVETQMFGVETNLVGVETFPSRPGILKELRSPGAGAETNLMIVLGRR